MRQNGIIAQFLESEIASQAISPANETYESINSRQRRFLWDNASRSRADSYATCVRFPSGTRAGFASSPSRGRFTSDGCFAGAVSHSDGESVCRQ
jgi:hypothetical protein